CAMAPAALSTRRMGGTFEYTFALGRLGTQFTLGLCYYYMIASHFRKTSTISTSRVGTVSYTSSACAMMIAGHLCREAQFTLGLCYNDVAGHFYKALLATPTHDHIYSSTRLLVYSSTRDHI